MQGRSSNNAFLSFQQSAGGKKGPRVAKARLKAPEHANPGNITQMNKSDALKILRTVVGYKHPFTVASKSYFPHRWQRIKRSREKLATERRDHKLHPTNQAKKTVGFSSEEIDTIKEVAKKVEKALTQP